MTFPVLSANGPSGYNLTRSLRFRSSASAYLNRTPASASNRTTWTWSGWVKRGKIDGTVQAILSADSTTGGGGLPRCELYFQNENLGFSNNATGAGWVDLISTAVYRDPSAWYHIVCAVDTTQATTANRVKLYVNGVQITSFSSSGYPAQNDNTTINSTGPHNIARYQNGSNQFFDGYLAEVNFVDGQALTPSSFGSTNSTTGVWQPAAYTGTYGTNGFYLPFTNITSTTTLGYDSSGNGNNWTTNNISLTAGVTYDSMTDVPTLTSATAANYCVLNPLDAKSGATISQGNLGYISNASGRQPVRATIGVSSGKWYFEFYKNSSQSGSVGFATNTTPLVTDGYAGDASTSWGYLTTGDKANNATTTAYGNTWTAGDVIGVALDLDNGKIWFSKNNTWQASGSPTSGTNAAYTNVTGTLLPILYTGSTSTVDNVNFGQQPFSYTPPTGFVALNTYNLPASTIPNGASYMAATLYTGTLASNTITNTVGSASFQPDLVWIKSRSAATDHKLTDVVRGVTKALISDTTGAETTDTNGLTAFGSTGFTVGTDTNYNNSAATYVAWQWKAGGTAVSNTSGSITSSVSANTTSGFSVATYTGSGVAGTIGHGLGVAPSMIIVKSRSASGDWPVYITTLGNSSNLFMNGIDASASSSTIWNATSPTSSVFSVGINITSNTVTVTYVAYCFAAIKGFSAFGSYTGNGSSDGPFVYTGFRPRFVLIKRTDTTGNWAIHDTARNPANLSDLVLYPNGNYAEDSGASGRPIDILSNGFKARSTEININASGGTYIYAAFAESPFQNSLAR